MTYGCIAKFNINAFDVIYKLHIAYDEWSISDTLILAAHCRMKTYEHEDKWGKALTTYDIQVAARPAADSMQIGLLQVKCNV